MLKSSNLESIIGDVVAKDILNSGPHARPTSLDILQSENNITANVASNSDAQEQSQEDLNASVASVQLATGLLKIFEPPLAKSRIQLKELICKQNKIYIDISASKFELDKAEVFELSEMMNSVKVYKEKLIKLNKQMRRIHQRMKVLKKRMANIDACKQKELQRKLQKQQQEESLIGTQ